MRNTSAIGLVLFIMLFASNGSGSAAAQSPSWLDSPAQQWNRPGQPIPPPPPNPDQAAENPRCAGQVRPAETDVDRQVTDAGWRLVGGYQGGWNMQVVEATTTFDGMCRPIGYQVFVFHRGRFAGTMSPVLMASRFDGSLTRVIIQGRGEEPPVAGRLLATFNRYAESDPLCCPSGSASVSYLVDVESIAGPALYVQSINR